MKNQLTQFSSARRLKAYFEFIVLRNTLGDDITSAQIISVGDC